MERFVARIAVVLLSSAIALAARAAEPHSISTRCGEIQLTVRGEAVSRLTGCGDAYADDLLWHLDRIDQIPASLDGSFDRTNGGAGSTIYVMDTGVMASHSEFGAADRSRVVSGYDVASVPLGVSNCSSANKAIAPCWAEASEFDAASHGTAVASVIAGATVGVAPDANIISIRVMNERGLATTRTYLAGLDAIVRHAWAAETAPFRTAIVNISGWVLDHLSADDAPGAVPYRDVELKMRAMIGGVDAAGEPDPDGRRFLFVVAGNNTDGGCGASGYVDRFPAILGTKLDGLITVGGMTPANVAWRGACRGGLEVLAPAQGVYSATITGNADFRGRKSRNGTSFAAPVISGIAARLLADRPDLSPEQLEAWITSTPSRVAHPDSRFADGKVAYIRSIAPVTVASAQRSADE